MRFNPKGYTFAVQGNPIILEDDDLGDALVFFTDETSAKQTLFLLRLCPSFGRPTVKGCTYDELKEIAVENDVIVRVEGLLRNVDADWLIDHNNRFVVFGVAQMVKRGMKRKEIDKKIDENGWSENDESKKELWEEVLKVVHRRQAIKDSVKKV